jgi:CHRD domain/IPT/TIG domain
MGIPNSAHVIKIDWMFRHLFTIFIEHINQNKKTMKRKLQIVLLLASLGFLGFSCKEDEVPPPTITSFTPDNGVKAATVTITGTNFSATPANNIVKFNGTTAVVTASTATSITTTVPAGSATGKISVDVGGQVAESSTNFRVDDLFRATLNGANERPTANTSTGTGTATLTLNKETKIFTLNVTYTGLTGAATNGHIHKAAADLAGPAVFPFTAPFTSPINYTSAALTQAQIDDLHASLNYVNIHTAQFPGGEIRGQLIMQ